MQSRGAPTSPQHGPLRERASACRSSPRCRRGFTLIESVATIVILAVLASLASFILAPILTSHARASTAAQLQLELSTAMERIEREFRSIPLKDGVLGAPDISSVGPSSMTWKSDITLSLSGGKLRLREEGPPAPPRVLLSDVSSFTIQAFDESDEPLAADLSGSDCDAIQRLLVSITAERNGVVQMLRTKVFIRSTMRRDI